MTVDSRYGKRIKRFIDRGVVGLIHEFIPVNTDVTVAISGSENLRTSVRKPGFCDKTSLQHAEPIKTRFMQVANNEA